MVTAPTEVLWANQRTPTFTYLVAEDAETGEVIGTVTGVDHRHAFDDPEDGTSLWCLAVDPQTTRPGVGAALVRTLPSATRPGPRLPRPVGRARQRAGDRAVREARVRPRAGLLRQAQEPHQRAAVRRRPAEGIDDLNPYARIIADEALRRGITVEVVDAESRADEAVSTAAGRAHPRVAVGADHASR
jgi:GNAT superfamily N-acetyltransferase